MSLLEYPPVMIISGMPGTGKTTIARKILKENSDYMVIEQVDVLREVLKIYMNNWFTGKEISNKYIKIMEILNQSSYELSDEDYIYQCNLLTPAIIGISNRLYKKGIPLIIEGVNIDIQTILSSSEFSFEAKSNEILFINLLARNDQYLNHLNHKLAYYSEDEKAKIIKLIMNRGEWLFNKLNNYIVDCDTNNIFNIDLSCYKIFPHPTKITEYILSLSREYS